MSSQDSLQPSLATNPCDAEVPAAAGPHAELLGRIWRQTLPLTRDRVGVLAQTALLAGEQALSQDQRTAAADLAHKLAGSLGMFGYPRGTEIAREMENLFEADAHPDPTHLLKLVQQLKDVLSL